MSQSNQNSVHLNHGREVHSIPEWIEQQELCLWAPPLLRIVGAILEVIVFQSLTCLLAPMSWWRQGQPCLVSVPFGFVTARESSKPLWSAFKLGSSRFNFAMSSKTVKCQIGSLGGQPWGLHLQQTCSSKLSALLFSPQAWKVWFAVDVHTDPRQLLFCSPLCTKAWLMHLKSACAVGNTAPANKQDQKAIHCHLTMIAKSEQKSHFHVDMFPMLSGEDGGQGTGRKEWRMTWKEEAGMETVNDER